MNRCRFSIRWMVLCFVAGPGHALCFGQSSVPLPAGVQAVWDLSEAQHDATSTRQRFCINGLWRWQPAGGASKRVPDGQWGYFKVPGCWPGITNYMQKDCQTVWPHPAWQENKLAGITAAWYQREITVPANWSGRHVTLVAEYLNSYAAVYIDGKLGGELRFPGGRIDLTSVCEPGHRYTLSLLVVALPLDAVMLSYSDSNSARSVKGSVARRGLCGDVYLASTPAGPHLENVHLRTSVRRGELTVEAEPCNLGSGTRYTMRARVTDHGRLVREFTSHPFGAGDLHDGRPALIEKWVPDKLWDTHTPENMYELNLALIDGAGQLADAAYPVRFGFREFWIDGRDFYLNGDRIFLSAVPLDNAQVGAAWATYDAAAESLKRLQSFGINCVYTHNYGCQPGSHLGFTEILRAADDVGMLVAFSQPHFAHYDWKTANADRTNGYARHAEFYVRAAWNHPSVVMYSMSHNATGYSQDMNPDMIDGVRAARTEWSLRNVRQALRAEAIVRQLDPSRIIYHHSSGNLSSMHTSNFYPNFVPIQEMSDWFEHWATEGVKPFFTCEYGAPFLWDWAMYRGWYKGTRNFGSAQVPWDFCLAEWNAQFLGDRAFQISEQEKRNLRWEAEQFREGRLWHRWDYPHQLGSSDFDERYGVLAAYLTRNWRAFRTWGVSAISPWEHHAFWKPRPDLDRNQRVALKTDWQHLQRPGFSPDYLEQRYERMDMAYERSDWVETPAARAMIRNNVPLLAYLAGKPGSFTSQDHNFLAGETVEKQIIVINNSRRPVTCDCSWSCALKQAVHGATSVHVGSGQQRRIPLTVRLPAGLQPGSYQLTMTARFHPVTTGTDGAGETQADEFAIDVLPPPPAPDTAGNVALFDPRGETTRLLDSLGVTYESLAAGDEPAAKDLLIIGKGALTTGGPAPDVTRVRDGLRVVVFEQTPEALEARLGFRVAAYGLRNVFRRVPDHPVLSGLAAEHLHDWRGSSTTLPPRLECESSDTYNGAPVVRWCGFEVPRLWRCGNRGNVASVLIEKPARGDFLPIVDGGFSLQYSPLLEYREGRGMLLFCQMDVTGRTEDDPAAKRLAVNMLNYVSSWKPSRQRRVLYAGDDRGRLHLESAGISVESFEEHSLTDNRVLVVGAGGGSVLARQTAAVRRWLRSGGYLLALGLDAREANMFLPAPVRTTRREHIAAWFAPPAAGSLLAGVGPADVHNRDPRELPLVSDGAKTIGDGVLAQLDELNAVFCQLAPYEVSQAGGANPSFAVITDDAVEGKHCAAVTMGTLPWAQFGQKIEGGEVGRDYTMSAFVRSVGQPVSVRLEVERAGRPWDRAVRGEDVQVGSDRWTELHVTFKVDKPFGEGWQAYLHCGREGARFLVDLFQLYEGPYVAHRQWDEGPATGERENRFANASFETGTQPWFFTWRTEQQNLRRTYRRSSFLVNRLLANMGVRGQTPLLTRLVTPTSGVARASVVRNGSFDVDADKDGMPDAWQFSRSSKQATCVLDAGAPGGAAQSLRVTCPAFGEKKKGSVMLAQHDVPVKQGQWYRISLRARSHGLEGRRVTLAVTDTSVWRALIEYQRFASQEKWKEFTFLVQASGTATEHTRFQIWHDSPGTLWLSDIRMAPCDPPSQGRWTTGLYADQPQPWDDPYRFFRW